MSSRSELSFSKSALIIIAALVIGVQVTTVRGLLSRRAGSAQTSSDTKASLPALPPAGDPLPTLIAATRNTRAVASGHVIEIVTVEGNPSPVSIQDVRFDTTTKSVVVRSKVGTDTHEATVVGSKLFLAAELHGGLPGQRARFDLMKGVSTGEAGLDPTGLYNSLGVEEFHSGGVSLLVDGGLETADGSSLRHYSGKLDARAALAAAGGTEAECVLPADGDRPVSPLRPVAPARALSFLCAGLSDISVEYWIDGSTTLRRAVVRGTRADGTVVTIDRVYRELNQLQTIVVPLESTIVDGRSLKSQ